MGSDREIGDELLTDDYPEFNDYRTLFLFLETSYTYRMSQDDVVFYQKFLNYRILEIEDIVDPLRTDTSEYWNPS